MNLWLQASELGPARCFWLPAAFQGAFPRNLQLCGKQFLGRIDMDLPAKLLDLQKADDHPERSLARHLAPNGTEGLAFDFALIRNR